MLFIGIDGGGTKCQLALCDETGRVLSMAFSGGCNPNLVGMDAARASVKEGLIKLLADFGGLNAQIDGLFAGIAGSTTANNRELLHDFLVQTLKNCRNIDNHNDTFCARASGLYGADGGVLICGTGVVGFVEREGKTLRVGGWGYLLDRGGSGYNIGKDALYAALRDYDTRDQKTLIKQLIARDYSLNPEQMIAEIYSGRVKLQSLCPLAFEAYDKGDAVAAEIIRANMAEAATIVRAMCDFYGSNDCPIVLAGGLMGNRPDLIPILKEQIGFSARLVSPLAPPVLGSVVLAARSAGIMAADEFAKTFANTNI